MMISSKSLNPKLDKIQIMNGFTHYGNISNSPCLPDGFDLPTLNITTQRRVPASNTNLSDVLVDWINAFIGD